MKAGWAVIVLVGALTACSGGHRAAPPPPSAPASTSTAATTRPDYSTVTLSPVAGTSTVPAVPVTPGPISVSGTVTDSTGAPVAAATVALERIVGSQIGQTQVTSAEDGTWRVQGILGGLYRIRAWRPPDLADPQAAVLYLSAGTASPPVGLVLGRYTGTTVQAAVSPNPPIVGEPANLVVQVTSASVGSDGIIRSAPQAGAAVTIAATGLWAVDGDPQQTTTASGQVSWQATCESTGAQAVSVAVDGGDPIPLTVPACALTPTTTTLPAASTTTVTR